METKDLLFVACSATAAAFALAPLLAALCTRIGLVAVPSARSSHTQPTPAGVGAVIPIATIACLVAWGHGATGPLLVAAAMAALGFTDDFLDLSPAIRMAGQFTLALGGALLLEFGPLSSCGIALMVMATVNGVNFMDGINGITTTHGMLWGSVLAFAGGITHSNAWLAAGTVLAAACLGYLPNNFPKASSFPGDVLPYFLATTFTLGLLDMSRSDPAVLLGLAGLAPMAADTFTTVLRRLSSGQRLTEAHRDHAYQRLARRTSHGLSTGCVLGLSSLCSCALVIADEWGRDTGVAYAIAACCLALIAILLVPREDSYGPAARTGDN